jgi:hypothetical protein
VTEARASLRLPPPDSADGALTVTEYKAKNAAVTIAAALADEGKTSTDTTTQE